MAVSQPVFGTQAGVHFGARKDCVQVQPDGRRAKSKEAGSFVLFEGAPISEGVFRCKVAFDGGDERQHVGVMPARSAKKAVASYFDSSGFANNGVKGWGCMEIGMRVVKAGAKVGALEWSLRGKTVEMIFDASSGTLHICKEGETPVRITEVTLPVIPAIYIAAECEAILISSSHEIHEKESEVLEDKACGVDERAAKGDRKLAGDFEAAGAKGRAFEDRMEERILKLEQQLQEKVLDFKQQISARDEKIAGLEQLIAKQATQQTDALLLLETRLFKQSAGEVALSMALAEAKAELQRHEAKMASLEALATDGAEGLDVAITAQRSHIAECQAQATELLIRFDALSDKKAKVGAALGDGHIPFEEALTSVRCNNQSYKQEVDVKLEALKMELMETARRTIKQPLDATLAGLLEIVGEIRQAMTDP